MTKCYAPLEDEVLDLQWDKGLSAWVNPYLLETVRFAIPLRPRELPYGPNSSFVEGTLFQFAWDSTSLGLLQTCPRKYYLTMREGWNQREFPPPLAFGLAFHACMELWHRLLADKIEKNRALYLTTRLALLLGETLPHGDTSRTKETLTRSVVWYIDQFWDDPARTLHRKDGSPMVEHSFSIPLFQIDGTQIYYCGHMDRPVHFQRGNYCTDYKTTGYELNNDFFLAFKPNTQMSGYNIAGHIILDGGVKGIIVDGIQLGVNYTRFRRHIIQYNPEEIEEDIRDIQEWIKTAHRYAQEEHWPKNPTACGRYFKTKERMIIDPGCHFRDICSKPPEVREVYLKGNFVKRNWDPLVAR